ncbi:MAG TPA: M28 family peptidase, partial [Bryobacteraceae bacterium]|nr:M28 family peptidase [Bryobacteraceae bacterium]
LQRLIWQTASEIGYGKYFLDSGGAVDDDHMPFVRRGVNAINLIDFDYGPNQAYWHTGEDSMDKISAHSLQVVGDVLVGTIKKLDQ